MTGTVKWFNDAKGYGFIETACEAGDIFVHYGAIIGDGYRTLNEGDQVAFDVVDSPKGAKAENVAVIAAAEGGGENEW